jgi:hypothetical protein
MGLQAMIQVFPSVVVPLIQRADIGKDLFAHRYRRPTNDLHCSRLAGERMVRRHPGVNMPMTAASKSHSDVPEEAGCRKYLFRANYPHFGGGFN